MGKNDFNPIINVLDDELYIDEVGLWAEKKYKLVGQYCNIFTTSMKYKWNNLIYIDLFSGCGYAKIRDSKNIIKSSSLISLSIPHPFTKYIFCEKVKDRFEALKQRVERDYKNMNILTLRGDCNLIIDKVIEQIPKPSKTNSVLTFCFVDPFSIDLSFNTIKELSQYKVDFLILLAFGMDVNRNIKIYLNEENNKIDNFLGNNEWRTKFNESILSNNNSGLLKFLADEYQNNMKRLGYLKNNEFHQIRSTDKNLPLYHLAFFSRSDLGNKFWKVIQKYADDQERLF